MSRRFVYLILIFLAVLWGGSLRRRVFQRGIREAVFWATLVWVLWMGIRLVKLALPNEWTDAVRFLWYAYYPCMGLIAFSIDWIGYASNQAPDDAHLPVSLRLLLGLDVLLSVLVLTNDAHWLVFRFPWGMAQSNRLYTYGPGYYWILFVYMFQLFLTNGWICWEAWKQKVWNLRTALPLLLFGDTCSIRPAISCGGGPFFARRWCWLPSVSDICGWRP
jgi:hypothetical protein